MDNEITINNGYVVGVRCGKGHSGNQQLVPADTDGRFYECCGCRTFYTHDQVSNPKNAENGSGGVILG